MSSSTIHSCLLPKLRYLVTGHCVETKQRSPVFPSNFGTLIVLDNQNIHLLLIRKKTLMTLMRLIRHLDRTTLRSNGREAAVEKKIYAQFEQT
jgi:hypothetical protein